MKSRWMAGIALVAALLAPTNPAAADVPYGDILAFSLNCKYVKSSGDDPIVFPHQPEAAHRHNFFGNPSTDSHTTTASLVQHDSTCTRGWSNVDRSAYWVPALMKDGKEVLPRDGVQFTAYYRSDTNRQKVTPFPLGLRMIGGDPKATTYEPGYHAWGCRGAQGEVKTDGKNFPTCAQGTDLKVEIGFPSCWNGRDLDSPDHQSHMSDKMTETRQCVKSHPVHVPSLTIELSWPGVNGDLSNYSLSSGPPGSSHGDFFNGWDPNAQQAWVNHCIRAGMWCEGLDRSKISFTPAKFDINALTNDPKQASAAPPGMTGHDHASGTTSTSTAEPSSGMDSPAVASPVVDSRSSIEDEKEMRRSSQFVPLVIVLAIAAGLFLIYKRRPSIFGRPNA